MSAIRTGVRRNAVVAQEVVQSKEVVSQSKSQNDEDRPHDRRALRALGSGPEELPTTVSQAEDDRGGDEGAVEGDERHVHLEAESPEEGVADVHPFGRRTLYPDDQFMREEQEATSPFWGNEPSFRPGEACTGARTRRELARG